MSLLDKIFFWRKPKVVVVQKNNVAGGDMIAGNKFVRPVPSAPLRSTTTKPQLPQGTVCKEYETKGTPVRRAVEDDTPSTTATAVSPFPSNGYFMNDHIPKESSSLYEAPTYVAPAREVISTPSYVSSRSDYSSSASSSSSDYSSYSCSGSSSDSSSSSSSFD